MRDVLEDWSDNPIGFMGFILLCCVVVPLLMAGVALVLPSMPPFLNEAPSWAGYAFCAAVLAIMLVGALDEQTPGAARALMPIFCLVSGLLLLWLAEGSVVQPPDGKIAWGRLGGAYVVLGVALCVAKLFAVTSPNHRYR